MAAQPPQPRPVRMLSEQVTNQIAAGEVVERPASVLKELMENSLDAGAGRIVVEVEAGGRRLIKVVDDGAGMNQDDLLMALERHATSKLATSEELEAVATMGFRGEALPSIAAVSKLKLRSRAGGAEAGCQVSCAGGKVLKVEEVGAPVGTLVEVRDLFYNTPARKKFLKSAATESGHLGEAFLRLALARPEVAFRYKNGGRTQWDLPPTEDLAVRAATLLGRDTVAQMVLCREEVGPITVTGLVGQPSLSRAGGEMIHTYVNRRYVRDRVLLHAVGQAYRGLLPRGRRPVCVVMVELDPAQVDVNVHPAKVEVRFRQQGEVHDALVAALLRALGSAQGTGVRAGGGRPAPAPGRPAGRPGDAPPRRFDYQPARYAPPGAAPSPTPAPYTPPEAPAPSANVVRSPAPNLPPAWPQPPAAPAPPDLPPALREAPPGPQARALFGPVGGLTVLGQLHGLYVICAGESGLVIMDQHAAHERLTFQEMKDAVKAGGLPSQGLITPVTLELGPREAGLAEAQAADWARLGLTLEPFGGGTWLISGVPPVLAGRDPAPVVRDLIAEMAQGGNPPGTPEFLETALASLACRASIKSGQRLGPRELQGLVDRACALTPPVTCPHGRPVFLTIPSADLARWFKRSGEPGR